MKKAHLFFKNPRDGVETFRQKLRFPGNSMREENEEIDVNVYTPHKEEFRRSKQRFISDLEVRRRNRISTLNIPEHIEYVLLNFFDFFNSIEFETSYRRDFGLVPIKYYEYNTLGLFAINEQERFNSFLSDIDIFLNSDDPNNDTSYNHNIRYIKNFKLLTTERIINYRELKSYARLSLIDKVGLFTNKSSLIETALCDFIEEHGYEYIIDEFNRILEINNISENDLLTILDNYDIVHKVSSPLSGLIVPNSFNLPQRSYGFTIVNSNENLPVIGVIDSGISNQTPLSTVLLNRNDDYNMTATHTLIDNLDHGTGVAAFAAFGSRLITNYSTEMVCNAKLLSIKIIDNNNSPIMESKVLELIKKAHFEEGVKIFVLTVCYCDEIKSNSEVSDYARAIDNLTYELDILIFISTGNLDITHLYENNGVGSNPLEYPKQFDSYKTCLCTPSESYNSISCGAIAENLESYDNALNLTPSRKYPACYTRKFHLDPLHPFFNRYRINGQLLKPDMTFPGGDHNRSLGFDDTGITVLSSNPAIAFKKSIGTSYSAPLLANLAARILHLYPQLNMQTVKAILVNSSVQPDFANLFSSIKHLTNLITGKGTPNELIALYSDENNITLVLEDMITPGDIKSFPIRIPEYLLAVERENSLLEFNITLCFKFLPVQNNQLTYCPINVSFGVFKNLPLSSKNEMGEEVGINGNSSINIKLRNPWSQNYYWRAKLLSNCQKSRFNISKQKILEEKNQFKLVIKSELHKLLPIHLREGYSSSQNFSIVLSIKENAIKGKNTNKLYNEMILINSLESIATIEGEVELEA